MGDGQATRAGVAPPTSACVRHRGCRRKKRCFGGGRGLISNELAWRRARIPDRGQLKVVFDVDDILFINRRHMGDKLKLLIHLRPAFMQPGKSRIFFRKVFD
jgi:hypothetical protein